MSGPIIRILLRVLSGFLIAKGWFAPETIGWIADDPDVIMVVNMAVGGVVWAATEAYYWMARKFGWRT